MNSEVFETEVNEMEEGLREKILAKKSFAMVGWGFFAFMVLSILLQGLSVGIAKAVLEKMGVKIESKFLSGMIDFVLLFAPMYLFGLPVMMKIMEKVPTTKIQKQKFGVLRIAKYFVMSISMMATGNLIGTGLAELIGKLARKSATNGLAEMITEADPLSNFIFVVLIVPFLEELVFRKILIDRTVRFGERNAVLLSGIMFGLFHMNLYQFFYTTALGMLFAYVYVRSGKLFYTYLLHALINFLGSTVAVFVSKAVDPKVLELMQQGRFDEVAPEAMLSAGLASLYGFFFVAMAVLGFVIIFIQRKKMKLDENGIAFDKKVSKGLIYGNYGMAFFIAVCVVMMGVSMIAQLS